MKKSAAIGIAIGVALIGIFAIVVFPTHEPVTLTFLQYYPSTHGARFKLTNASSKTLTYLTDKTGAPVLSLVKTAAGWTNTSPRIMTGTQIETTYASTNVVSSTTNQIYFIGDLVGMTKHPRPAEFEWPVLQTHTLEPGESTRLYVSLEADGARMRVGTVCIIPQSKLAEQLSKWIDKCKSWLRMKPNPHDQIEVWCNEALQVPSSTTRKE